MLKTGTFLLVIHLYRYNFALIRLTWSTSDVEPAISNAHTRGFFIEIVEDCDLESFFCLLKLLFWGFL